MVQEVRRAVLALAPLTDEERTKLEHTKLMYGVGRPGVRGVTIYHCWSNGAGPDKPVDVVEIGAVSEESHIQLCGTVVHELAHVLAGYDAGHGKAWKDTANRLGLRLAKAAGHLYQPAYLAPAMRERLAMLRADDGRPLFGGVRPTGRGGLQVVVPRPCGAGIGTHGGTSRGVGSGSRMHKAACPKCGYTVRVSAKWIAVALPTCTPCGVLMTTDAEVRSNAVVVLPGQQKLGGGDA